MRINLVIIKVKVDVSVTRNMVFPEISNWKFKIFNRKGIIHKRVSFVDDLYATICFVLLFFQKCKEKKWGLYVNCP